MSNIKTIYEFEVKIEKDVKKTETKVEEGKEIVTTTTVKELVPVYFAFKKGSRTDRELCEEFRAAAWSKAVEKGILPEAILLKSKFGETFINDQRKNYIDTLAAMEEKRLELEKEGADKDAIMKEISDLNNNLINAQREQLTFFENTAEVKARLKAIEWLTLNMSYFREDNAKNWEPFFKGDTLINKYDYCDKLEDEENELYVKSRDKLAFISAMFLSLGNGIKKEDVDEAFKQ